MAFLGANTHNVYKYLKAASGVSKIEWNFATYFIISGDGHVEAYSDLEPYELKDIIVDLMNEEL